MGLFSMNDLVDSTKHVVIQGGEGGQQKTFFEVAMNGNLVPSDDPPLRDDMFTLGDNGNIIVTG